MDQQTLERIEAYVDGTLTGAERTAFEQRLESDPALAQEVALQRQINEALHEPAVADLEEKLTQIILEERPAKPLWRQYARPLAIAASVLLLLGFAWLFRPMPQGPLDQEAIYLAQAKFPESLLTDINVRDIGIDTLISDSLTLRLEAVNRSYQEGEWQLALDQLDQAAGDFPELVTDYTSFYQYQRGILLLGLGSTQQAITALEQVRVGPQLDAAQWFLLLGRFRLEGDTPAMRNEVESLARSKRPYADEAKALLEAFP
ncbi:MAG: hypothetical protein AAFV07_08155 [Bacteroidota bacterium]